MDASHACFGSSITEEFDSCSNASWLRILAPARLVRVFTLTEADEVLAVYPSPPDATGR
ncbi:hypothetical protein QRX60_44780 [Amycolatopsis mongoliensis]|uniref:Uncharacterized protein n=1 Tax=Amycolatopsis mongoliensis TaxID=715475 RepID=A0A9Y2JM78_9PSEU|nr:hypothetical protein [Amycolatopsis sp. 4-36]WIY01078.1 hypothetical protein QRX60_44780 [Amycolatopsis sp. 4-36]